MQICSFSLRLISVEAKAAGHERLTAYITHNSQLKRAVVQKLMGESDALPSSESGQTQRLTDLLSGIIMCLCVARRSVTMATQCKDSDLTAVDTI